MNRMCLLPAVVTALCLAVLPAAAGAADRDRDGLPDRWEKRNGLSTKTRGANADPDRDRVDNRNELRERTSPRDRDSDNDGILDGREDPDRDRLRNSAEDATGNDPIDPDTDRDGVKDGAEQAGVVASFEDGTLTIDLAGGGSATGEVTEDTKIKCESETSAEGQHRSHRGRGRGRGRHRGQRSSSDDQDLSDEDGGADGDDDSQIDLDEEVDEGGGNDESCPLDALQPGARVHQAELDLVGGSAVWTELELLR